MINTKALFSTVDTGPGISEGLIVQNITDLHLINARITAMCPSKNELPSLKIATEIQTKTV